MLLLELRRNPQGELVVERAAGGAWLGGRGLDPGALRAEPRRWLEWVAEEDREDFRRAVRAVAPGEPPRWCELRLRAPDGGLFWVASSWQAREDPGGGRRVTGMVFDWDERHAAEERLRSSEERHRELVENAHDLIYSHDLAGRFTSINRTAERLTGYTRDELMRMGMDAVVVPEHFRVARDNIAKKLEQPDLVTYYELEIVAKDGRHIPLEVSTRLIWEGGEPVGVQGIARDLTERKRAEAELARTTNELQNIMSTIADAVYVINMESRLVRWNRNVELVTGFGAEELENRPALEFFPEEDRQRVAEAIGGAVTHGQARVEARMLRKDGSTAPYEFHGVALRDDGGNVIGVTGVGRDVSEQREVQEALAHRTAELARSNEELQDFAQIVSHDLKAPLRHIHNYATFLLEDYGDKVGEEGREQLEALRRMPVRLQSLIDALLEYSRLGRRDGAVKPTDLDEVLREVLEDLQPTLQEGTVKVSVPRSLPTVLCDRVRAATVLLNLISNAARYNDKPERRVEIGWETSGAAEHGAQPGHPVFWVRDNGIGIREEDLQRIFRIFRRLHGRDEFGGGQGAGLAIVKKIVEQGGGRIWPESELGQGTTMRFTLGPLVG